MSSFKGYLPNTAFVMAKHAKPLAARAQEIESLVDESFTSKFSANSETPATTHSLVSMSSDSKTATPKKAEAVSAFTAPALEAAKIIFIEATQTLSGASAELLNKMIDAMGVKRDQAVITNLAVADFSSLIRDYSLSGKVVVVLGDQAARAVLNSNDNLPALRARVHFLKDGPRIIATFHPTYLLENAASKKDAWEDLKLAMREISQ